MEAMVVMVLLVEAGGVSGDGGGGGSGYTDDTFDIINAELGGNTTASSSVTFQVVT